MKNNDPRRGPWSPFACPDCGEWETTVRTKPTWWEAFWKDWDCHEVWKCPCCDKRYSTKPETQPAP